MKTKNIFIQTTAMIMCVITLSLSVGGKFCFYDNISKAHAADPFTITMGSLALEEIIMGIAIAVLGADVAYQYRDEILDAYKEFSKNGNNLYAGQNLFEVYSNGERSVRTWDEYEEILKGMGSTASEAFDDYKDKFNNVYVRPAKEYLQYVTDFYTDLFTGAHTVDSPTYIPGLADYLNQSVFTDYTISNGLYQYSNPAYFKTEWIFSAGNKLIYETNVGDFTSKYPYVFYAHTQYIGSSFGVQIKAIPYNGVDPLSSDNTYTYISNGWNRQRQYDKKGILSYDSGIGERNGIGDGIFSGVPSTYEFIFNANVPFFANENEAIEAIKKGDFANALNYAKTLDSIAVTGDDIPTVGNWEELWERLKNPDLPWWFCDPDALGLSNASDLPWFDVAGLHDWANDIPGIKDGIIDTNPDIPWTDVWDKVIDVPDVVIPAIDFPYVDVDDPAKPKPTVEPTVKPTTEPLPTTKPGEIDSAQPVVDLSKFFPFCIPFDLIHLVQALDADPVAPKWTLKLEPPQFPVEWEVTLDLSQFESLAKIFRTGETLLFVVGLILITRGIIKG